MGGLDIEQAWATIMLLLFATGGFVPILMKGLNTPGIRLELSTGTSSPISRVMIALMWIGTLLPALYQYRLIARYKSAFLPLLPYVLVCVSSILWSQDVQVSARKIPSMLLSCLFGLYLAVRFPVKTQLTIALVTCSALALLSLGFIWVEPRYALDHAQHMGAWQGVFSGKNGCAMVMAVGMAAAVVYQPRQLLSRVLRGSLIVLFAVIIYMSQSSGALVVIVVVWLSLQVLKQLTKYERGSRALIACLCFSLAMFVTLIVAEYLPILLKLLHRDSTLTGRTDIWKAVLASIFKHPLLGYGFGAFWLGLKGESASIAIAVKWVLPNAHNGFLDVWLSVGIVGVICFIYAISKALWLIWTSLSTNRLEINLWPACIVILVLAYNMDESVLASAPNLIWTLFVSAICALQLCATRKSKQLHIPGSVWLDFKWENRAALGQII